MWWRMACVATPMILGIALVALRFKRRSNEGGNAACPDVVAQ